MFDSASRLLFFLQDLEYLCEGLEGRSSNPVAVLFDSLLLPDSDFGLEHTSPLEWRYEPERAVPHLVLGKGPPGGAWHVRTFSCSLATITDDEMVHVKCSKWHKPKSLRLFFLWLPPVGHGGLHADSELGQLDGASWTQTQGLDERKTKVRTS